MNKTPELPKRSAIDRLVGLVSPRAAFNRVRYRAALQSYDYLAGIGSGYVTSKSGKRSMRGFHTSAQSADKDTIPKLSDARADSRDLYMNTPVATAMLRRIRTNAVGMAGLQFQSRIDRRFLGLSDDEADEWERQVEREFNLWARSKDADFNRQMNFYQLQPLAFLSVLMNGDAFALMPFVKRNNPSTPYQLALKMIEADLVCNPPGRMNDKKMRAGIEFDDEGQVWRYHIKADPHMTLGISTDFVTVDAFGEKSGRRNVLHLIQRERFGQSRGMPYLASFTEPLKQATRLSQAELDAAVVASFFTVFIKSMPGALGDSYTQAESILHPTEDGSTGRDATSPDNNRYEMGPASIIQLEDDESIDIADPKRPNDAFEPFFNAIVRQIGAAGEVPFEQLMLAFTASYSASRAALLEAWKFYRGQRHFLATEFCQPVYEEWLSEAILLGRVRAPGFLDDPAARQAWTGSQWTGPGQGQLRPDIESKAAGLRVDNLISTREDEYAKMTGGDYEKMVDRLARENRMLEERNLSRGETEGNAGTVDPQNDGAAEGGDGGS